jgi:2,4-dienoyl-CoA reductase-like NADH-dependent reductase (Old Yellow Enzyme family)
MSTTLKQSFTPVRVGRYTLPNRLVMAPMTRNRAKYDGTPGIWLQNIMRSVRASA